MLNLLATQESTFSWFSPSTWIGLPKNYAQHGDQVDHMMDVINWFMLALFVGWSCFFIYCLLRFRQKKNPKASYHGVKGHASTHLEIGVVIIEAVLLLGFAFPLWAERTDKYDRVLTEDPVRVRVIGYQFNWKYHYPGPDNKFGYIDLANIKEPADPCIDPENDLHAQDDFTTSELIIPEGRPIILQLTSTDVIHNYSIIPLRIQQDAIPGKDIPMWFTANEPLTTFAVCGQLCGQNHAGMRGTVKVVTKEDYAKFLKQYSK